MNCPSCDEPLVTCEYDHVEVDWCAACGGVWLDAGEFALLESVQGVKPLPPMPLQRQSERRCPVCAKPMTLMRRAPQGGDSWITIDACPHGHGEWYDAGELEALLRMPGSITGNVADPLKRVFGDRGSDKP